MTFNGSSLRLWSAKLFYFILLILALSGTAHSAEKWLEVRTPHFTVLSNGGEKSARRVAKQFELIRAAFQTVLKNAKNDPAEPILIYTMKSAGSLEKLFPEYEQREHLPAGFFRKGMGKYFVAVRTNVRGENPYTTIYHEYFHLLTEVNLGRLPTWVSEGLAEFWANTVVRGAQFEIGHPERRHLEVLRKRPLLPLEVLFAVDHRSPYYKEDDKKSLFYAQSWALAHYAMLGDETGKTKKALAAYLKLVQDGAYSIRAAEKAFGDLTKLEQELTSYIKSSRFLVLSYPVPIQIDEKTFPVRRLTEAEGLGVRADFIVHGMKPARARPLLYDALKKDPQLMLAHECMGFSYVREQKLQDALRWFEKAIELGSKNYLVHFEVARRGAYSMGERQSRFERVVELNPDFVPALFKLARNYLNQRKNLENAQTLANRIVKIEPEDPEAYLLLGSVHNAVDEPDEAVSFLRRAVQLAPASSRAHCDLGKSLLRTGKLNESVSEFQEAIGLDQGYAHAHHQLGLAFLAKELPEDAATCFRTVLKLEPNNALAHYNLGMSLQRLDSLEDAKSEIERARSLGFIPK